MTEPQTTSLTRKAHEGSKNHNVEEMPPPSTPPSDETWLGNAVGATATPDSNVWRHWDVAMYRSGFDDITIRLVAKDSQQACQKALKAYGSWNVVRTREIESAIDNSGLWERPWMPTTQEGEELTLNQIVTEAIGTGSICWHETPTGIFNSEMASWVAGGAINEIEKLVFWQIENERKTWPGIRPQGGEIDEKRLRENANALIWAEEFDKLDGFPDQGTMIGWFANAMQAAVELDRRKREMDASSATDIRKAEEAVKEEYDRYQETKCAPSESECGKATQSEEDKLRWQQRQADKADIIEMILSYRNPASDEEKLRQVRVVMD